MNKSFEYSAGLVSQSFWFIELKKVLMLRQEGLSYKEIKKICVTNNLFGAPKEYRALRMAGYVVARAKLIDDELLSIYLESDTVTQKLITLITILKSDTLFLEFLYEVYREKVMLAGDTLDDADVKIFFTKKELQSDIIANWQEVTKRRLRSAYVNFLIEAGLLVVTNKKRVITQPILDSAIEIYLKDKHEDAILKAFIGGV